MRQYDRFQDLWKEENTIMTGWIPVEVAIPPAGKEVITTNGNRIALGELDIITRTKRENGKEYREQLWKSNNEIWKPTHWMPLPLPPENK